MATSTGLGGISLLITSYFETTTLTRMHGALLVLTVVGNNFGKMAWPAQQPVVLIVVIQTQIGKNNV